MEQGMSTGDLRRRAPATLRNRDAIMAVLAAWLPPGGAVLEIAAGSGEHGIYFAPRLPGRVWLPSDRDPAALASIAAWREASPCEALRPPIKLDVLESPWPVAGMALDPPISAIVCINMLHIAPWAAAKALFAGAGRLLPGQGRLILYGPFKTAYGHTAPSNAAFDQSLRAQNPEWGVRDLAEVITAALAHGLVHRKTIAMPANNLSLVFERG